jgi:glycosyltransferase involved in cell wall biosynthesis
MAGKDKVYEWSIIIPHKNIPRLLERCLDSIPQRDDVQIIVVDDASDPTIVDFARFPGLGRSDTKIIFHKAPVGHGGAGLARNVGMNEATGRWLVFADADDVFLPEVEAMMNLYVDSEVDIVFFASEMVDAQTMRPQPDKSSKLISEAIANGDTDRLRYGFQMPWGKFIKRDFIQRYGIRFEETIHANDVWFSYVSGYFAREIAADPTPIYCYMRRSSSLTGKESTTWESELERFGVVVRTQRFLESKGKGAYFKGVAVARWKRLMRIDRKRAMKLLPVVKELTEASKVRKMRIKLFFERILFPFGKV